MRVAIFTDTFNQINGVAMVYNRFARWCARRGHSLDIFTPGDGEPVQIGESVRIHNIGMYAPIPYYNDLYFDAFPFRKELTRYFEKNHFDLVHIATQGHMGFVGLKIADRAGLKRISCYHTAIPEYAYDRFITFWGDNPLGRFAANWAYNTCWWWQRLLFSSSSLILVPTKSIKEMIDKELGIPTAYFTRGVNSEDFNPEKRSRPRGEVHTLYAGRISVEKNLLLLDKLNLEEGKGMVFVGDGPDVSLLSEKMPEAHFTGFLRGDALQQAYADADVFVFPSKTDTFGNAVLEAMSSGLPVVVTNVLGPKDFVEHGKTGFIARDDDEFVHYHNLLVEDAELRKTMGAAARNYALSRSWDAIFENELIGNYRRVISGDLQ